MTPVDAATDALACYRLTRLVVVDEITAPLREKLQRVVMRSDVDDGAAAKLNTLIRCPWCASWWLALVMPMLPRWAKRALALSAVAGILGSHYND